MAADLERKRRTVRPATRSTLLFACVFLATSFVRAEPAPFWKGVSSAIVPGSGQALSGDHGEAAAHFGIFGLSLYNALRQRDKDDFLDEDTRYDEDNDREVINRTTLKYDYAARLAFDTALYSSYAAYRDARQRDNAGYRTPLPRESLTDLARAPFSLRYLSRPTTFVPLVIQAAAVFADKDGYRIDRARDVSEGDLHAYNLVANEMVAVGEEAFFRGFLNNEFSERYGNRWGLTISSVIFGLGHTGQGQTANALQATAAGLYLGWLHQRNDFEAGEGVALHYWVNVLAGISAIRNGEQAELLAFRFSF